MGHLTGGPDPLGVEYTTVSQAEWKARPHSWALTHPGEDTRKDLIRPTGAGQAVESECILWVGVFETPEVTLVGPSSRDLGSCGNPVFSFPCLYGSWSFELLCEP